MELRIERLCVERGLKMTGQRRVIARVLSEASDHPDVEELYRRASALDARISIATVYRTVRLLEEKGILERRDFGGGRARYEPTEHGHHYHLIDIDTGKVIEFQDPEYERLMQTIAERLGFDLVSLRLELFGRRREPAQAARDREARQRLSRRIAGAAPRPGSSHGAGKGGAMTFEQMIARTADRSPPVSGIARRQSRRARSPARPPRSMRCRRCATACSIRRWAPRPMPATAASLRDRDAFDAVADHLLVVDHAIGDGAGGRRRHLPADPARGRGAAGPVLLGGRVRHHADHEFPGRILELGRSCVDAAYRSRVAMQLLWRGIAAYVFHYQIDLMFGCASLHGTDPDALAADLTYLYHNHLAPPAVRPRALPAPLCRDAADAARARSIRSGCRRSCRR